MKNQQIISITGMHRSGTSLAASWLELCGLFIHDGSVWGSGPGNPQGHFEDKDFVALHDSAIKSEKSNSRGWILFPKKPMFFKSDKHLSQALDLIQTRNAKYKFWGWKDPRTALFLEQWKKILPLLKVVMIWRPCNEVLRSLIQRSKQAKIPVMKIGLTESIRLWKSYNRHLIGYKKNHPQDALLFSLKDIIYNDREALNRINCEFNIDLDYRPIDMVFNQKLLTYHKISYHHRLLCKYFGSQLIEKILSDFSERLVSK